VLGHELSGVIDEIDSDEESLKAGDKVGIIPYRYCGKCNTCKQGKTNCCPNISVMGVHEDGGMQEYISVPTSHLLQVNDLSLDEAALLERSEEHTSELQSRENLVCRLLLEKK